MKQELLKLANSIGVIEKKELSDLDLAERLIILAMESAHRKGHNEGFSKGVDQASLLIHNAKIK